LDVSVLVTCAGAAPAIAIMKALKAQKAIRTKLYAVSSNRIEAGFFLSDRHCIAPPFEGGRYLDFMIDLCRKEGIDVVFPVHDDELLLFAERMSDFRQIGVHLVSNEIKTIKLCRDKYLTYLHAKKHGIEVPETWLQREFRPRTRKLSSPLVVKPRIGRGSRGVHIARSNEELVFFRNHEDGATIIQEYLPGREFTIDVVTDMRGKPLTCVPRERLEVRGGIAVLARTVKESMLDEFALKVLENFNLTPRGNIQCRLNSSGSPSLIEVNPKFSASLPITTRAGVNIPLIVLKQLYGLPIDRSECDYEEGVGMVRYLSEFFFDYDSGKSP
jgi:carbamoyl-phosphate synthase large subunit